MKSILIYLMKRIRNKQRFSYFKEITFYKVHIIEYLYLLYQIFIEI